MPIQEWDSQKFQIIKICSLMKEAFINKPEMRRPIGEFPPLSDVRTKASLLKPFNFQSPKFKHYKNQNKILNIT